MADLILLIHGFGGGVFEVEPLAEYLTRMGHTVICPVLKGHSGQLTDMKRASWKDWIDSVEKELLPYKEAKQDMIAIGFSMGGLIALHLFSKYNFKAMITINTPIYFWNLHRVFLNLIDDMKRRRLDNVRRYLAAQRKSPLHSMIQFLGLLRSTKAKLVETLCPILILQADDDDTVRRKSAEYILKHVSSEQKKVNYFNHGGHVILLSPTAEKVEEEIAVFLKNL